MANVGQYLRAENRRYCTGTGPRAANVTVALQSLFEA